MTVSAVLQQVAGAGARVSVEDGHLRLRGPREAMTPELKRDVAAHKVELLAVLAEPEESIRARLRVLSVAADPPVNLDMVDCIEPDELRGCRGLSDETLVSYLLALSCSAARRGGSIPAGWTSAAVCARCGPVWLHPGVTCALPSEDGPPRALACPWCFVRSLGISFGRPQPQNHTNSEESS